MIKFSERLQNLMEKHGMRFNTDLARACGWMEGNQSARVGNYLKGIRIPEKETAEQIAKAFKLTFEELIEGTDYKHAILIQTSPPNDGKVPVIHWHDVPKICKNPKSLKDHAISSIDIRFRDEKDLFITRVPDAIIPGRDTDLFNPKDDLLISHAHERKHNLPVIVSSNPTPHADSPFPVPEYAIYLLELGNAYLKFKGDRYVRVTPEINICGVVVARLNIFI